MAVQQDDLAGGQFAEPPRELVRDRCRLARLPGGLAVLPRRPAAPPLLVAGLAQQSPAWIERQMAKVHAGLKVMADNLGEQPFCMGIQYTLADVAFGCTLGWLAFRFPDIDWRGDYPNLARLADKLAERASFKDTVPVAA